MFEKDIGKYLNTLTVPKLFHCVLMAFIIKMFCICISYTVEFLGRFKILKTNVCTLLNGYTSIGSQ